MTTEKLGKRARSNRRKISVLISVSILGMIMLSVLSQTRAEDMKNNDSMPNVTHVPVMVETMETSSVLSVPMQGTIQEGTMHPRPMNIPSLREYDINKDSNVGIWYARNPESYIVPNSEWVKHVASELYVDDNGRIRYKNMSTSRAVDYNGNVVLWTDEPFLNNYVSDDELFNFPANADLWQNADYYLSHGLKGDCEDWAIAVVSMMFSGEMSTKENGIYLRQVIPAKAVIGYSGKSKDVWVEYNIYGERYISSTGTEFNRGVGKDESVTTFHPENGWRDNFKPIYQFTNMNFGKYINN